MRHLPVIIVEHIPPRPSDLLALLIRVNAFLIYIYAVIIFVAVWRSMSCMI